jgi:orotate phosphoribosyltransferase
MRRIEIAGDRHLETLRNCGGYYECPRDKSGRRLGPLVGYAGKYQTLNSVYLQWVGDVYANFAKAEIYPHVLKYFASCLSAHLNSQIGLENIDVFCGAPIGGYSLADALGFWNDINIIKAEKKVVALATPTSREKSELVFARHNVEEGQRCVIVEDVCNNFSTTAELIGLITASGGVVVAIACFLNRSLVDSTYQYLAGNSNVLSPPVISVVRKFIQEWKQDDPAVSRDIAKGNVVWKPKDEWPRLMEAMARHT